MYIFYEFHSVWVGFWQMVGHLGFIGTSLYISSLQFWQRNRPGFAALFGIHVALCFDGVFVYVIVSSLMFMCTIFLLLSS